MRKFRKGDYVKTYSPNLYGRSGEEANDVLRINGETKYWNNVMKQMSVLCYEAENPRNGWTWWYVEDDIELVDRNYARKVILLKTI